MLLARRDLLVSDAERDAVAHDLKRHYADGRLTSSELADRIDATYRARRESELLALLRDLPRAARPAPAPRPVHHLRHLAFVVALILALVVVVQALPPALALIVGFFVIPMLALFAVALVPLVLVVVGVRRVMQLVAGPRQRLSPHH